MAINGNLSTRALYEYGVAATVAVLPWSYHWSANVITVTCLFGLLSTSIRFKIDRIQGNLSVLAFIGLYLIYVIGIFYSTETAEGLKGLEQKIFFIGLPLVAATCTQLSLKRFRFILMSFVFSNLILTLTLIVLTIAALKNGTPGEINFDFYTRSNFLNTQSGDESWMGFSYIALTHRIIDPTYFSIYLVFSLSILFHFDTKLSGSMKWIIGSWFFIFIILLASRIGIILLGIISVLLVVQKNERLPKMIWVSALALGFIVALSILFPVTRYRLQEPLTTSFRLPSDSTHWNSTNLRLLEWDSGLKGINKAGLFGTGTGSTWPVIQKNSSHYNMGIFSSAFNLHNQYLETFLEIGLAGFILLLICYFVPFQNAIRNKDNVLLSLVILISMASLTESILERAHGLIFFTTFASLLMYSRPHAGQPI